MLIRRSFGSPTIGSAPLETSATREDAQKKTVKSGSPEDAAFLLSIGYVLALSHQADWPEASKVAGSGFRDMSRLAAGDPELYAGIAETNRENMVAMLDAISSELARLRRHLEADDPRLVELFEEARSVRERWARDNR